MAARFNEPRRSSDSSRCFPRRRHLLARTYTLASAAAPAHWPRGAGRGAAGRAGRLVRMRGRQVGVRGGSGPGGLRARAPSRCGPGGRALGAPAAVPEGERARDGGNDATAPSRPGPLTCWRASGVLGVTRDVRSPEPRPAVGPGRRTPRSPWAGVPQMSAEGPGGASPARGDNSSVRSFIYSLFIPQTLPERPLWATPIARQWRRLKRTRKALSIGAWHLVSAQSVLPGTHMQTNRLWGHGFQKQ